MTRKRIENFARKYGFGVLATLMIVAIASMLPVQKSTSTSSFEPEVRANQPVSYSPRAMADDLPLDERNPYIQKYVERYTEGPGRVTTLRGFERAREKRAIAERIFVEEGVPADLVWLAQVESGWRLRAVSPAAAAGVWQFIPRTAIRFGLQVDDDRDDRYDYEKQTRVAARYLRFLYDYFDGNWELAIGAYNCGEENMDRAIARANGSKSFWTLREQNLLPKETAEYVPKVLAASIIAEDPARFGISADGSAAASAD